MLMLLQEIDGLDGKGSEGAQSVYVIFAGEGAVLDFGSILAESFLHDLATIL